MRKNFLRFAIMALFIAFMASCSKDDDQVVQKPEEPQWTVRPDFATLDTRPQSVIEQFTITDKDTKPVKLDENAPKGRKYAIVIGISDYYGSSSDLQYCDDDAIDWYYRLRAEGYTVYYLLNGNATKENIELYVNWLASVSTYGNEIAFCYSGHGSNGNIISADLYYISSSWFRTKFYNSTSNKMMFCFDACQIGAMKSALAKSGRVIAVASSSNTYSYDGDPYMNNGVFTYYMMYGFDNIGYNYLEPDCQYAVNQMYNWAYNKGLTVAPSYADYYSGNFDL
ncbi:MAG: hypothetical protein PWR03_43 [Tenuifilum sp.]|jgi:hypothetical protein|uniref:caspase family protein n=1 Tax=Tenuifilum sp. TaxID=2760880 RepID=UPI0024AA9D64|nr:caspase family protein [Tenuifilum sp.]MDI3525860.1 hypothetical protein [Tenuifilum sp.]